MVSLYLFWRVFSRAGEGMVIVGIKAKYMSKEIAKFPFFT